MMRAGLVVVAVVSAVVAVRRRNLAGNAAWIAVTAGLLACFAHIAGAMP